MIDKLPDLRGVHRAEIWGITVITCFNLVLLAVAIRFGGLGPALVILLVLLALGISGWVVFLLLRVRQDRDYFDTTHKAVDQMVSISREKRIPMEEDSKTLIESVDRLSLVLKDLPCQKNLPPDV